MEIMIEEYGLIIVVICLILLMLSFSTGAMGKSIMTDVGDKVDKMTALPKWASVTDTVRKKNIRNVFANMIFPLKKFR